MAIERMEQWHVVGTADHSGRGTGGIKTRGRQLFFESHAFQTRAYDTVGATLHCLLFPRISYIKRNMRPRTPKRTSRQLSYFCQEFF